MITINVKQLKNEVICEGGSTNASIAMCQKVTGMLKNDDVEIELIIDENKNFYYHFIYTLNMVLDLPENENIHKLTVKSYLSFHDFYRMNESDIVDGTNAYTAEVITNTQERIDKLVGKTNKKLMQN